MSNKFCGICGWPLGGEIYESCNAPAGKTIAGEDFLNLRFLGGPTPEDYPDLIQAFLAWKQKNWNRVVGQSLIAYGVDQPLLSSQGRTSGWVIVRDSAAIYITLNHKNEELTIESPVIRLPVKGRIPLMRTLLELNGREMMAARFCLRGDLVVLRFMDRMENLSPPKLIDAIDEVAILSDRYDDYLSVAFSARMIGPEAQRMGLDWKFLGTPVEMRHIKGSELAPAPLNIPGDADPAGAEKEPPGEIQDRIQAASDLCEIIRDTQDLSAYLLSAQSPAWMHMMLHRAVLFRILARFGGIFPNAAALLLKAGKSFTGVTWAITQGKKEDEMAKAMALISPLLRAYDDVLYHRGQVSEQELTAPPAFESAEQTKRAAKHWLLSAYKGADYDALRFMVLMGALSELQYRAHYKELSGKLKSVIAGAEDKSLKKVEHVLVNTLRSMQ